MSSLALFYSRRNTLLLQFNLLEMKVLLSVFIYWGMGTLLSLHLMVPAGAAKPPSYVPTDQPTLDCDSSSRFRPFHDPYHLQKVIRTSSDNSKDGFPKVPKSSACIIKQTYTYSFPVSPGPKFVCLSFYLTGENISNALFSISIGQYTLLRTSRFSYSSAVKYVLREFIVMVDGSVLNITFTPSQNSSDSYAFVNKIEVVSMPYDLYFHNSSLLHKGQDRVLETVHRSNIGGALIEPEDDTGMLRQWENDEDDVSVTAVAVRSKVGISYTQQVPEYTAPVEVYSTARTWYGNTSWTFRVDPGFCYLIRLHFCEIISKIYQDKRIFEIHVNNRSIEDAADIMKWSGKAGVPVCKDYIVNSSAQDYLEIAFHVKTGLASSSYPHGYGILDGVEIFKLPDLNGNLAGRYPFGSSQTSNSTVFHNNPKLVKICAIVLFGVVVSWLSCFVFLHIPFGRYFHLLVWKIKFNSLDGTEGENFQYFSLAKIRSATKNFSSACLIGNGGFGKVYKGSLSFNGDAITVAVKRANPGSHQGIKEFETEISMLSKLRHRHLVSLIGCCTEEKEMILVYNFMQHGTLREHLYKTSKAPLPWKRRLRICIGAARGLHYLHTGAKQTIIHRDVKSTNILLDNSWEAKVSDFGLSKIGPNSMDNHADTHVTTKVKGSFGYLDPEYYRRMKLTEKSDVYSFGVVMFEVMCAKPAIIPAGPGDGEEAVSLAELAAKCYGEGTLDQIIDPVLQGNIDPICFKTFADIARKCLADTGKNRPSMGDVLANLELAWQQQNLSPANNNTIFPSNLQMIIDSRFSVGPGNSDKNLGMEFSEIIHPVPR